MMFGHTIKVLQYTCIFPNTIVQYVCVGEWEAKKDWMVGSDRTYFLIELWPGTLPFQIWIDENGYAREKSPQYKEPY